MESSAKDGGGKGGIWKEATWKIKEIMKNSGNKIEATRWKCWKENKIKEDPSNSNFKNGRWIKNNQVVAVGVQTTTEEMASISLAKHQLSLVPQIYFAIYSIMQAEI